VDDDKHTLISIVHEMSESMTGAQSTRHWAEDALWFDIPAFASRGIQPALKMFDKVFGTFQSCKGRLNNNIADGAEMYQR
jgi:ketosteroid isomerase-like protein